MYITTYWVILFGPISSHILCLDLASHDKFLWKDTWVVSICKCILKYVRICARLTLHSPNCFAGPSLWGIRRNMSFRKRRHRVVRGQRPAPRRGWATRSGCRRTMDGICTGWSPQILRTDEFKLKYWYTSVRQTPTWDQSTALCYDEPLNPTLKPWCFNSSSFLTLIQCALIKLLAFYFAIVFNCDYSNLVL